MSNEKKISLSLKERLQLSYQLKILEKLYPDEAEDYAAHRKAVENGYALHYDWMVDYFGKELPAEECEKVIDILDMYATILNSYEALEDKSGIDPEEIKFKGFDGNNEAEYRNYALYFMYDLERFNELHVKTTRAFGAHNSHRQMLYRYENMLKVWKSLSIHNQYDLTKEDIIAILGA